MPKYLYPELARKLAAAAVSHIAGAKSIDRFLRDKIPSDVAPMWHEHAERIMDELSAQVEKSSDKAPDGPKHIM